MYRKWRNDNVRRNQGAGSEMDLCKRMVIKNISGWNGKKWSTSEGRPIGKFLFIRAFHLQPIELKFSLSRKRPKTQTHIGIWERKIIRNETPNKLKERHFYSKGSTV